VDRTLRAALLAAFIGFAAVAGSGIFLGFAAAGSLLAGVVVGALAALLLWGAARRAETFEHPTPPTPGFPGAPDHADGTPSDPTAADRASDRDATSPDDGDDPR
jgi:hypothetical protein